MPAPYRRPDHFTKQAKAAGFAARSVFKLDEIEQRFHVARAGGRAIDLGCFPGSWSRWLMQRGMRVTGVDLSAPTFSGDWIVRSAMEVEAAELLASGPVVLFVSDMAPNTSGDRFTDHVRQIRLAERALLLARACLQEGGAFVVKVFDGEDAPAFQKSVAGSFRAVHRVKPEATRSRSVEFFLVGLGFRGAAPAASPSVSQPSRSPTSD